MSYIIAIDGPAGSGKGTITEILSKKLNLTNINTGGAYRCVALLAIENGLKINQKDKIIKKLDESKIEFKNMDGNDLIFLNGKDVTKRIREADVSKIVSQISSIKEIRLKLTDIFRECGKKQNVIMEGRDIGTYVFPNADVKIYLDASSEVRAKRRKKQCDEQGIKISYEEILKNIETRDKNDKSKTIGTLKQADDAIYINSDNLTIEQEIDKILELINNAK